MIGLQKRVSGDWIEFKEKANGIHLLLDLLQITPADMKMLADRLRLSVEQGIIEFKRTELAPVLVALETVRYKTLPVVEMGGQEKALTFLLFTVLVQRLLAAELLPLSKKEEKKRVFDVEQMKVATIIADVNLRIKADPSMRISKEVKNIFAQVQVYKRENQKLRELFPSIKPEMQGAFLTNFSKRFEEIIGSIKRHYTVILEQEADALEAQHEGFSLARLPLKEVAPLLASQAKELSRMRSTLAFARDDKYKTREIMVSLYEDRHAMLRLIEEETALYKRICNGFPTLKADSCAAGVANGFRDEICLVFEKQGKREPQQA